MDTILHVVEIEAPPESVYEALTTTKGLAGWWSTRVNAASEVGGIVDFTFVGDFNPDMQIAELDRPNKVVWKCVAGHDPWQGSSFSFELTQVTDSKTRLMFTQSYGAPIDDVAYGIYNFNWGYYLFSLQQLVETGNGFPYSAP